MPARQTQRVGTLAELELAHLDPGEFGFCVDVNKLYIGMLDGGKLLINGGGNGAILRYAKDKDVTAEHKLGDIFSTGDIAAVNENSETEDKLIASTIIEDCDYGDYTFLTRIATNNTFIASDIIRVTISRATAITVDKVYSWEILDELYFSPNSIADDYYDILYGTFIYSGNKAVNGALKLDVELLAYSESITISLDYLGIIFGFSGSGDDDSFGKMNIIDGGSSYNHSERIFRGRNAKG